MPARLSHVVPALAGAAAMGLPGPTAHADVEAAIADLDLWYFDITHMPDFDQRRVELPWNSGAVHCAPTAHLNLMAYIAAHGVEPLSPGVANWQAPSLHGYGSFFVNDMATDMQTGSGGTNAFDAFVGTQFWLSGFPGWFTVSLQLSNDQWSPRFQDVAIPIILDNSFASLSFGWYTVSGSDANRNGGHRVTVVTGARTGNDIVAGFRDPATGDGIFDVQSAYTTEEYAVGTVGVTPNWLDDGRAMDVFIGRAGAGTWALMETYITVTPAFALVDRPDLTLELYQPWGPAGSNVEPRIIEIAEADPCGGILLPEGRVVVKALDSTNPGTQRAYIGRPGDPGSTWQELPIDGVLTDIRGMVYGRHRAVYLFDPTVGLLCYDIDLDVTTAVVPGPPHPIDTMAYLDDTDELVLLSTEGGLMYKYDARHLHNGWIAQELSFGHGLLPGARMVSDPATPGQVWAWNPDQAELFRVSIPGDGIVPVGKFHAFNDPIEGLAIGDGGLLLVSHAGLITQYSVASGAVVEAPGHFTGQPGGSSLVVSRSTTNYDPAVHAELTDIVIQEPDGGVVIPDCLGDADNDGDVGISDLLALLAAWDTAHPYLDLAPNGGDETVDIQDLLALLAAWGPCP